MPRWQMYATFFDALSREDRKALAGMPCVVLGGAAARTADPMRLVRAASELLGERFDGKREPSDVTLPALEWGVGRTAAVDRRYGSKGTLWVSVPAARRRGQGQGQGQDDVELDDEDEDLSRNPAVPLPIAGVLEVVKRACESAPPIDGGLARSGRRTILVHLACRMSEVGQKALARMIESSMDKTLFVLTALRTSALHARLRSLALSLIVGDDDDEKRKQAPPPPCPWGGAEMRAAATSSDAVAFLASADATLARIRRLGGDPPDRELLRMLIREATQRDTKTVKTSSSRARRAPAASGRKLQPGGSTSTRPTASKTATPSPPPPEPPSAAEPPGLITTAGSDSADPDSK